MAEQQLRAARKAPPSQRLAHRQGKLPRPVTGQGEVDVERQTQPPSQGRAHMEAKLRSKAPLEGTALEAVVQQQAPSQKASHRHGKVQVSSRCEVEDAIPMHRLELLCREESAETRFQMLMAEADADGDPEMVTYEFYSHVPVERMWEHPTPPAHPSRALRPPQPPLCPQQKKLQGTLDSMQLVANACLQPVAWVSIPHTMLNRSF